jgi:hypothetical protein
VSFEGFGVGSSSAVWGRRAVTIPLYLLLTGLAVVVLPFALVGALCVDLTRGGSFPAVRTILFFAYYLACESLGLVASFLVWLAGGLWGGASRERYLLWNFRLQCAWARWLFSGASRIFSFHVEVEGEDSAQRGPLLLFMRHASVGQRGGHAASGGASLGPRGPSLALRHQARATLGSLSGRRGSTAPQRLRAPGFG